MTPRGRPGRVPIQTGAARVRTGPEVCAAGRLPRNRRRGADAHPGSQVGCSLFRSWCASLVDSAYDVRLTTCAIPRCRWRTSLLESEPPSLGAAGLAILMCAAEDGPTDVDRLDALAA